MPTPFQKAILKSEYDIKIAGHMGINKILKFITWNFWWPGITRSVCDYIRSYYEYQYNKTPRHVLTGLF